jgi:membrane protein implicated in regulation of membrane protease activity
VDAWWSDPVVWTVAALALVLVDVFLGFVLLPFAAGFALLALASLAGVVVTWQHAAFGYAVAVVAGYLLLRWVLARGAGRRKDVNDY